MSHQAFPKRPAWYKGKKSEKGKRRTVEQMDYYSLVKTLDKEISDYVRMTAAIQANMGGLVRCYTCGSIHHWKDMDCGHMIRREYMGTRFDYRILRCQCTECNRWKDGMQAEFRNRLVQEMGEEFISERENYAAFYGQAHPDDLLLVEEIKEFRATNNKIRREYPWVLRKT